MSHFLITIEGMGSWTKRSSVAKITSDQVALVVEDEKTYGKTARIQREILPTSSDPSGRSSKMCEMRQSNDCFEAWALSGLQKDSRQMGVGISTFCQL
jgi:hypothetical protein